MPSTILAIAGIGLQVYGAASQASAQKKQANYQAQVEENNAIIAAQHAADVRVRGRHDAAAGGVRTMQTIATAKAAIAANGFDVNSGPGTTAAMLVDDLARAGAMDVLTIRDNSAKEEYRAKAQGVSFTAQAGLDRMKARSISPGLAGLTAGISGLLDNADLLFPQAATTN